MAAAIEVDRLTKSFKLYKEKPTSLKERVLHSRRARWEPFTALDDISLDIEAGTTVGLLGHNGSGKSTLLKCMAGILQPTAGSVRTVGRMAALLELGAGFHPELSGRENVYLNGSILGLKKVEVERVFDDIVSFAELEAFIDMPVKHYSSGMYVRLGFAVAINVDPEILLVDEVLAVGDESFQRKCIDKVKAFQAEGRTIVVVTHAADLVRQMCNKAAALERGLLVAHGEPNEVIREFRERLLKAATPAEDMNPELARSELSPMWGRVKIADTRVVYATADQLAAAPGEPMELVVTLDAPEPVDDVVVGIAIYNTMGWLVYGTNTDLQNVDLGRITGRRKISFHFDDVPLLDGTYAVTVGVHTKGGLVYDSWEQLRRFEVAAPGRDIGIARLPVDIRVDPPESGDQRRKPGRTGLVGVVEPGEAFLDQRQHQGVTPRSGRRVNDDPHPDRPSGGERLRETSPPAFGDGQPTGFVEPPVRDVHRMVRKRRRKPGVGVVAHVDGNLDGVSRHAGDGRNRRLEGDVPGIDDEGLFRLAPAVVAEQEPG